MSATYESIENKMATDNPKSPKGRWRPMLLGDVPEVNNLANRIHINYPEEESVFSEKFQLFPHGCFTFETRGRIDGYCFSHPWLKHEAPSLDARLVRIPEAPSTYFIHDIAVSESQRGKGIAGSGMSLVVLVARLHRLSHLSLISVNQTELFWKSQKFLEVDSTELQNLVKTKYSNEAVFMERTIEPYF
jgi:GNAT superfamily N-acetyltransferase